MQEIKPRYVDRTITYAIDPENGNGDWKHFDIDPKDGTIRSKSSFDREHKSKYTLAVISNDGHPSAIPNIQGPNKNQIYVRIEIGDKNDNVPFFEQPLYELPSRKAPLSGIPSCRYVLCAVLPLQRRLY